MYHHYALLVELLGDKSVPPAILTEIKTRGLYRKPRPDIVKKAYQFGNNAVFDESVLMMTDKEFDDYLNKNVSLFTRTDRDTLELLHRSFYNYVKSLSDDFDKAIEESLLSSDKKLQRVLGSKHRPDTFVELERRKAIANIAKDLSAATEKQVARAVMVSVTETNNAYQDGRIQRILQKSGEADPNVFKRPRRDACHECKDAYLEDDGVTPKLFKLNELVNNGTNIGKSRSNRLPVIESHHPYCACEINYLPRSFGFDSKGSMVFIGATVSKSAV
jgi:hypothetical protein